MPIDDLKRVLQVLYAKRDSKNQVSYKDVEIAIITEIGYDKRTFKRITKALNRIGWLKRVNRWRYQISNDWVTNDF